MIKSDIYDIIVLLNYASYKTEKFLYEHKKAGAFMQNEKIEKRRKFIINTVFWAIIGLIVFVFVRYIMQWLMPFVIGFLISLTVRPAVNMLYRFTRLNKKISGIVLLLAEYALLILALWLLGARLFASLSNIFMNLPEYYDKEIQPTIAQIVDYIKTLESRLSPETLDYIYSIAENAEDSIRSAVLKLSAGALSALADATAKIPMVFISTVFTILSSVFISIDFDRIKSFVKKQLPTRIVSIIGDAKLQVGKTILRYLRAYLILFIITFTELSIGLTVLNVENSIGIASIIALADILPVIGSGTALIPWAVWSLFNQNYLIALGLIVLYLIIILVRNFIEPKVIGDQLGLNPVVTLLAIYLGYLMFGVFGMICLPILTTIIVGLHNEGKIKIWH